MDPYSLLKILSGASNTSELVWHYSRNFLLATTELLIESSNVYIETEKKCESLYSFFDACLRGCMVGKSGLVSIVVVVCSSS